MKVLFKLDDGSTKAVNIDNCFLVEGFIAPHDWIRTPHLFTAVTKSWPNNIAVHVDTSRNLRCYLSRLEDNSALVSCYSVFHGPCVMLNNEDVVCDHRSHSPIIFTHLTELEYTFL